MMALGVPLPLPFALATVAGLGEGDGVAQALLPFDCLASSIAERKSMADPR